MRHVLAALALVATVCIAAPQSFAAEAGTSASTPPASELAPPADTYTAAPGDADTPPPFVSRPKLPPWPKGPDMTYAVRPAPTGFRNLSWGTSLKQAAATFGLVPVTSPRPLRDTYYRPDEVLKLGMADIRTVAYYFHKDAFNGAGIVFSGEANFFLVKDHLIELYGPGRQVGDHYGWTWSKVNIDLHLKDGMGELRFSYEP
ncbi:MAG: hypothetical protein P4L39_10395 [Humidesulfovibrio sp.]|nr:hypothetical protein [Humidesulfovibrio sp.]